MQSNHVNIGKGRKSYAQNKSELNTVIKKIFQKFVKNKKRRKMGKKVTTF